MTPEKLRGLANTTGMIYDITMCREIFRAHAAALEEIERLREAGVGYSQQTVDAITKERESLREERDAAFAMSKCECESSECCANLVKAQERAEKAERRAERLKGHADAMAHYTDCYKDKWPDSGARQTLDEYRAEFKEGDK